MDCSQRQPWDTHSIGCSLHTLWQKSGDKERKTGSSAGLPPLATPERRGPAHVCTRPMQLPTLPTWHTSLSHSARTWSYSLSATKNMMEVTLSKQWIHFRLSDRWPPTSTILSNRNTGVKKGPETERFEHHCFRQ